MSALVRPFTWFYHEFGIASIHGTGRNAYLIIVARSCRMFAYGANSLILAIFFSALEFTDHQIGLFMTLTLLGDILLGTFLTLVADRVGRRRILLAGSVLMVASGIVFALFENFWILLLAAVFGVISATGGDFGPFRTIEESMLSEITTPATRSDVLSWYVSISAIGSSLGSEASGRVLHFLQSLDGWTSVNAYHALFWAYAGTGVLNIVLILFLTEACELTKPNEQYAALAQDENDNVRPTEIEPSQSTAPPDNTQRSWFARMFSSFTGNFSRISAPTRSTMYKLWFLLAVDSIADGMVPYTLTNYYLDTRFHPSKSTLGDFTSVSYLLSAIGSIFAGPLARKIGLINTMVFTHVPSSAAVLVFPFAPQLWLAAVLLFIRTGLNNMDQAPRSSFIAAVVKSDERTAVLGITTVVRTLAAMSGPTFTGLLAESDKFWIAFIVAGSCRLAYDFGLYAMFVNMKLYGHETNTADSSSQQSDRRLHDEEESLELKSLADSESDTRNTSLDSEAARILARSTSLGVPIPEGHLRSRSPSPARK